VGSAHPHRRAAPRGLRREAPRSGSGYVILEDRPDGAAFVVENTKHGFGGLHNVQEYFVGQRSIFS